MHSHNMLCVSLRPIFNNLKSSYTSQVNLKVRQLSVSAYSCQSVYLISPNNNCRKTKRPSNNSDQLSSKFGRQLLFGGSSQLLAKNGSLILQHRHNSSYLGGILKGWTLSAAASEPPAPGDAPTTAAEPLAASEAVEYIPVPPAPLEAAIDPATLNVLGEATLKSLGMAGMSPVGLMQQLIEFVHVSGGLPWWGAIAAVTVTMRVLLFPVIVVAQRNAAKLSNVTPQMQVLQMKITEAREAGDELQVARYTHELMSFMKQNDVNPLKNMVVPLAQAPIFISMFVGLRRCASLPVASFMTGGMLWFPDLTVADPYYALPILTSVTMYLTIQLGTEVGRLSSMGDNAKLMMTVMRLMPVICFPFMINFPSAVLCYWLSTNLVSLGQAGLLRIPVFREFCNIPQIINHHPDTLPITKKQNSKSTIETVKDSWRNMKVANQVQDRHRYDEVRFAKAGTGPVVRTFKVDPTKGGKKTSQSPLKIKATVKS